MLHDNALLQLSAPIPGQRKRYAQLYGSSDALALAEIASQQQFIAIFTETALDAQRLFEEIAYFNPDTKISLFPDWETLPYDSFSPHPDLISERLSTLYQILNNQCDVIVIPATTALYRLPPVEYLAAFTFFLRQGDKLNLDKLRKQLTLASYHNVTQVLSPGEYSIRGGLIDLFPMGSALPYRIDLFDNQIETIRTFDVDTQRSLYPVNEIRLLPAREFAFDEDSRNKFRENFREYFEGDPSRSQIYKDVGKGIPTGGIEYYLPLFFDKTATIFDYLPQESTIVLHHDVVKSIEQFWRDTESRYKLLSHDIIRPLLDPKIIFLQIDNFFALTKSYRRIDILHQHPKLDNVDFCNTSTLPPIQVDRRADNPLISFNHFISEFNGRVLVVAENLGRRETMANYLTEYGLKPTNCDNFAAFISASEKLMLCVAPLNNGFILQSHVVAIVTETELYATIARQKTRREKTQRSTTDGMLRDLSEVKIGDPVVHEQHGIGRYHGLINLDLGEGLTEFLHLEYADNVKLYVPVSQLYLISRYSGNAPEAAPLHRLGSGHWEKAKRKAMQQVRDTAAELLNLYAQRALRQGHAFNFKQHDYEAFAEKFGFEETTDQAAAIDAVIKDLRSGKPMDRLICGDVGFGKTEVALRAAFIALMDGKQVAVLVPTTLLAEQHFLNFSDRFADWPAKISEISRFRSAKEQTQVMQGLANGEIDIVIGTHKLIQKDVKFKNLGLVIIDEEHRFGVRQKEQLKALRAEVDVLTLTATPIPRTLAMSLEGLRDFSIIATAPQKRLAIKTFVTNFSDGTIREAVLRELNRGGQIYFLHNEIDTIVTMRDKLAQLLPEARINIAHGQMPERELEHVMRDFYQQRFNILLCSTIIETGIDIPTANTIIINHANRFGLAQLHQLRGRVGRSHHQAYAYLLVHNADALTAQARKRLEAIQAMEELGAGFYLAMHDLEIRGAGEVLGENQSGEMQEIGFNLYTEMLNSAINSLKQGKEPDLNQPLGITTEINLHIPTLLPEDYCGDVHERLIIYKRLANCKTSEELDLIYEELIDRFGLAPDPTKALIESHRLRIASKSLGIARLDATEDNVTIQFIPNPPIDAANLIAFITSDKKYKLIGQDRLKINIQSENLIERISVIKSVFKNIS